MAVMNIIKEIMWSIAALPIYVPPKDNQMEFAVLLAIKLRLGEVLLNDRFSVQLTFAPKVTIVEAVFFVPMKVSVIFIIW
jgi:hypothetical protein